MIYDHWLASVAELSDRKKILLRECMGSAQAVYYIEETELNRKQFLSEKDKNTIMQAQRETDPERQYEELKEKQIRFLPYHQKGYPEKLQDISDKPYAIYWKGSLPEEHCLSVGIVGARTCTSYGEYYAAEYGRELARNGIQIISGLARGIDGTGQRGALMGGGRTYAVLGNGVDICYPRENIGLYMDILEHGGGILSEYPPGIKPLAYHFPRRNRIISGMSDIILVIEAKEKSGSLITVDAALEQGKEVYALPGPVNSELSKGCNRLIRDGAGLLLSIESFLEEIGVALPSKEEKTRGKSDGNKKMLESVENLVYSSVGLYPKSVSQITDEAGLPAKEVIRTLTSLEIQGCIQEISKNYYIKRSSTER